MLISTLGRSTTLAQGIVMCFLIRLEVSVKQFAPGVSHRVPGQLLNYKILLQSFSKRLLQAIVMALHTGSTDDSLIALIYKVSCTHGVEANFP